MGRMHLETEVLRDFAQFHDAFGEVLEHDTRRLRSRLIALGETWTDESYQELVDRFEAAARLAEGYLNDHAYRRAFLAGKLAWAERYLGADSPAREWRAGEPGHTAGARPASPNPQAAAPPVAAWPAERSARAIIDRDMNNHMPPQIRHEIARNAAEWLGWGGADDVLGWAIPGRQVCYFPAAMAASLAKWRSGARAESGAEYEDWATFFHELMHHQRRDPLTDERQRAWEEAFTEWQSRYLVLKLNGMPPSDPAYPGYQGTPAYADKAHVFRSWFGSYRSYTGVADRVAWIIADGGQNKEAALRWIGQVHHMADRHKLERIRGDLVAAMERANADPSNRAWLVEVDRLMDSMADQPESPRQAQLAQDLVSLWSQWDWERRRQQPRQFLGGWIFKED
jgi:hypothetical protein